MALKQSRSDLEVVRDRMSESDYAAWLARLEADRRRIEAEVMLFDGDTFSVRFVGYSLIRHLWHAPLLSVWQFLRLAFLLPRPLGNCLLFAYAVVRYVMRRMKGVLGL